MPMYLVIHCNTHTINCSNNTTMKREHLIGLKVYAHLVFGSYAGQITVMHIVADASAYAGHHGLTLEELLLKLYARREYLNSI